MMSRPLAVGLLAAGCLAAAAGGAYLSVQEHAAAATVTPAATSPSAVSETEAIVEPPAPAAATTRVEVESVTAQPTMVEDEPRAERPVRAKRQVTREVAVPSAPRASVPDVVPAPLETIVAEPAPVAPAPLPAEDPVPAPAPLERFEEVELPAASVIGFEIESALTSERAQVEDRVAARVARDVYAGGRLVIPAGSRATGTVVDVERGGKVKERARLGVRFHTLVLADGRQLEIQTETIYREGESPANDSSRKIGGGAIGGAVLGAITGGKKGAIIGGIAGAAGGTAVVMAGGRHAVTMPAGTVVTARLASPLTMEVERR